MSLSSMRGTTSPRPNHSGISDCNAPIVASRAPVLRKSVRSSEAHAAALHSLRYARQMPIAQNAPASREVLAELAPSGVMHAGINLGNPVIVQRDATGTLRGIGPALAREIARRAGVPIEFVPYDTAGKLADAVRQDAWDVAFLAVDADRAIDIEFTNAYVHIEGTYMVHVDSPWRSIEDVDRAGVRIAVGLKTAYDLFLTRHIRHAELVRAASSRAAIELFLNEGLEAVAGVRQPLEAAAASTPGLRVIDGSFMIIRQAAGVPKGRFGAQRYVADFIEDVKASGLAAQWLRDSGVDGATIAPAGG